jgi:hypothetical protein
MIALQQRQIAVVRNNFIPGSFGNGKPAQHAGQGPESAHVDGLVSAFRRAVVGTVLQFRAAGAVRVSVLLLVPTGVDTAQFTADLAGLSQARARQSSIVPGNSRELRYGRSDRLGCSRDLSLLLCASHGDGFLRCAVEIRSGQRSS